jgi:hypothetical protein
MNFLFLPDCTNIMSEERSLNFLEEIVEEDLAAGKTAKGCLPVSRPSLMVTCILAMPNPYA